MVKMSVQTEQLLHAYTQASIAVELLEPWQITALAGTPHDEDARNYLWDVLTDAFLELRLEFLRERRDIYYGRYNYGTQFTRHAHALGVIVEEQLNDKSS